MKTLFQSLFLMLWTLLTLSLQYCYSYCNLEERARQAIYLCIIIYYVAILTYTLKQIVTMICKKKGKK